MACNVNTLLSDGSTFQTLSERDQMICIAQLLCDISAAGGGGSGSGNVTFISGGTDPNGTTTATRPAIAYDDLGNLWVKTDAGSSNTGWEPLIQASASAQMAESVAPATVGTSSLIKPKVLPAKRLIPSVLSSRFQESAEPPNLVPELIAPAGPEMPSVNLGPTRWGRVRSKLDSIKVFLLSFFALLIVILPMATNGALPPPILHDQWTTNQQASGATGTNITINLGAVKGLTLHGTSGGIGYQWIWQSDHLRLTNSIFSGEWIDFQHGMAFGIGATTLGSIDDSSGTALVYRGDGSGLTNLNASSISSGTLSVSTVNVGTVTITNPIAFKGDLGTDDTANGIAISGLNAGATIAQWEAVYCGGSSTWLLADANGSSTYPARGLAAAAYANGNAAVILREGTVRNDAWNWTPGGTIFLSETPGALTQTAPASTVQPVGFALTADIAYFSFDPTNVVSGGSQTPWASDINGGDFSLTNAKLLKKGSAGVLTINDNAGVGAAVSYSGGILTNDSRMQITLTTGSASVTSGTYFTNTFSSAYSAVPMVLAPVPRSANTVSRWYNSGAGPYITNVTTTGFEMAFGSTTPGNNQTMIFDIVVMQ